MPHEIFKNYLEILNDIICFKKLSTSMIANENIHIKHVKFDVITVPADDLAPSGARTSAGAVMTKFPSHIYVRPVLQGFSFSRLVNTSPQLLIF